jgi:hypothetical protein
LNFSKFEIRSDSKKKRKKEKKKEKEERKETGPAHKPRLGVRRRVRADQDDV